MLKQLRNEHGSGPTIFLSQRRFAASPSSRVLGAAGNHPDVPMSVEKKTVGGLELGPIFVAVRTRPAVIPGPVSHLGLQTRWGSGDPASRADDGQAQKAVAT